MSALAVSVLLAASGGWRDPNRREYTVKSALEADPSMGLKPAMRCKAEILLGRVEDALAWARAFAPALPVTVFFDTATMRHLGVEREAALLAFVRG